MAQRPYGYRRVSRKARHVISRLRRSKTASVQDMHLHELGREINRRWFGRRKAQTAPDVSDTGIWRPLSRRAQRLLTELRKTKVWRVQQRLVAEIRRELEKGRKGRWARIRDSRAARRIRTRGRRTLARGKRAVAWMKRTRSSWASTGRAWQSAREPRPVRPARTAARTAPARTGPAPAGRAAPGSRPAAARSARIRS